MDDQKTQIDQILTRAEDALRTARHGFEDLTGKDKNRRFSGLRNLIVFGRSVTWILQNLRSSLDKDFDQWYGPEQEKMRNDPLMRYFVKARNEIDKQGKLNISTSVHISSFSTGDLGRFGPPPPGAGAFFIGDSLGGTGWEVKMPNGSSEKYYVELPSDIGEVTQHFHNLPEAQNPELKDKSVEQLCEEYLRRLDQLVGQARNRFVSGGS